MKLTRKSRLLIPITVPLDESTDPPLRRFVWLKRLLLLGAVLVLLVFLSRAWLLHREERRLAAEMANWKAAGLPILLEDFQTPPIPDEENAALAINQASQLVVQSEEYRKAENADEFEQRPWTPHTREIVAEALKANRPALDAARSARGLTRVRWDAYLEWEDLLEHSGRRYKPEWSGIRRLARVIRLRALDAHRRGDDPEFLECLLDLRSIARVLNDEPTTLSNLIAGGIATMAANAAQLESHDLDLNLPSTRALATRLILEFSSHFGTGPQRSRAISCEARFLIDLEQRSRPQPTYHYYDFARTDPTWEESAIWWLLRPQRIRHTVSLLEYRRRACAAANGADWPSTSVAFLRIPAPAPIRQTGVEPADILVETFVPETPDYTHFVRGCFQREVPDSFAAINLAARLYAIDHDGKAPPALAALVPTYLPAVPGDPLNPTGGPLRYQAPSATTQPFVYSLGTRTDTIASGKIIPTLAQNLDWSLDRKSALFVGFLNPTPAPPKVPSTAPATFPAKRAASRRAQE